MMVQPMQNDSEWYETYRKSPFVLQAAAKGNLDSLQLLLQSGRQLTEVGHICLSRRRRNSVVSNLIGCAAYYGSSQVLKFALARLTPKIQVDQVNFTALESQDIRKAGTYIPEFEGFTPLMLAVVSEKSNLDCVKQLLAAKVNFKVREKVTGDNLLHLAARSGT